MVIEIPGINAEMGLELYDGDTDMYLRFLRMYVSKTPASLEKLRNVSAETLHDYAVCVHGVKSISLTIGAAEVSNEAKKLEAMSKDGDLAGVQAQNNALIKNVENLVANIRSWLEKHDAGTA